MTPNLTLFMGIFMLVCSPFLFAQEIANYGNMYIAAAGNVYFGDHFTNRLGADFENDGTLVANGNWANNGTQDEGTGTVSFESSTSNQHISGTAITPFYDLKIDNSNTGTSQIVLSRDITVGNQLDLTDGIIQSSVSTIEIKDNATVINTSDDSFVDGKVQKIGDEAFTFPVGDGTNYQSIRISAPTNSTDHFTAQYFQITPDGFYSIQSLEPGVDHVSNCEYWILDRTNGSSNVEVTLEWDNNSCDVTEMCDLLVCRWDGSKWANHGNGGSSGVIGVVDAGTTVSGTGCATPATVNNFSPFTLGSSSGENALPVELINFDAEKVGEKRAKIFWTTANETNNDYFKVQKSVDSETWEAIGNVKGNGTSNQTHNYSLFDEEPITGVNYYRLKQFDFDGTYAYYDVRSVVFDGLDIVNVYPVPAKDEVNFVTNFSKTGTALVQVYDAIGKLVYTDSIQLKKGSNSNKLTVDGLATGHYNLRILSTDMKFYDQQLIVIN